MDPSDVVSKIAGHVQDSTEFHLPGGVHVALPQWETPEFLARLGIELRLTKFMVLEVVAGLLMIALFVPLARSIATGQPPRGRLWNALELVLVFLRDEVARRAIGRHDAARFVPLIWTIFFFILFCNLLGLVPWAGSPTGSVFVTGALAVISLCTVVGAGMARHGPLGFFVGMVPRMDMGPGLQIPLWGILLPIEIAGLCIRHCVLAVRLLANMFAGHLVLAVIVTFIAWTADQPLVLWLGVTIASVASAVALSLLELLVAFLQAYVFTFLSALFIGMAIHQH